MQIIMPKLGLTMTHGAITEWLKAPGDAVKAEEPLCAYETEKVTLELVAPADGVLVEILAPAGTTVAAGAPVCEFWTDDGRRTTDERRTMDDGRQRSAVSGQRSAVGGQGTGQLPTSNLQPPTATPKARALARQAGVDLATVSGSGPDGRVQAADVLAVGAGSPRPSAATPPVGAGSPGPFPRPSATPAEIKATPLARRIAAAEGIDLATLAGAGPEGTITREDVEAAVGRAGERRGGGTEGRRGRGAEELGMDYAARSTQHAARDIQSPIPNPQSPIPAATILPHTSLRRTIAERMTQSAFTAPHVTVMTEAEATNLVSARTQLNQEVAAVAKISYNTLLAALVARALREHPNLNAMWEPDGIRLLAEINIALAVDTERGLMTPVLRGVDRLSLPAIQRGYGELAARALAGKSLPDDFAGGTFTITNLGGLDVDGFTPVINPPQAAILGVGRIVEKPVARDGAVVIRPMITLSLSFDHRVVDGAPAAKFLQRVKQLVERPMALVLRGA